MNALPTPADESSAPSRIGRYDLITEIASGGMATVFLGRLSGVGGFHRLVAIKRLHPHLANEEEFVQMFLDEARLAAGIHHPNVVPILEVNASHLGYYLVMDYIEGSTLASLMGETLGTGRGLPVPIAVRVCLDLLTGLHAAHELTDSDGFPAGLVHRDVSPQNVLVGVDGICRITDFGVAHAATRLSETRAGQLKGKLAYMAPEQANPELPLDRRVDVFAAGVVLWEALTGKRLFKSSNDAATLQRILKFEIPTVSSLIPDVPEGIDRVCMQALQRAPDDRFGTCAEFAEALEQASTGGRCATARELAAYVERVIGAKLQKHRAIVRQWLALNEGSSPSEPRSAARLNVMVAPLPPPPRVSGTSLITEVTGELAPRGRTSLFYLAGAAVFGLLVVVAWTKFAPSSSLPGATLEPTPESARATQPAPVSDAHDEGTVLGNPDPANVRTIDLENEPTQAPVSPSNLPSPAAEPASSQGTAVTAPSPRATTPAIAPAGGPARGPGFDSISRENPYR